MIRYTVSSCTFFLIALCPVSAEVSSHFTSVEAVWGSSTNLTCVATGYPSPVVIWKFGDNTILQGVTTTKSSIASSSYLYLKNLHAVSRGGQYKCEASNAAGPADSVAFNITCELTLYIVCM